MSESLLDSKNDIRLNLNLNSKQKYFYRLKVNINGFRLEDIKVNLIDSNKENERVKLKISACRTVTNSNNDSTSKEYVKHYEILKSKSNINTNTMRFYLDQKNPLYLIIEFVSNSDENVYINLDDSCESLVEMAAKSLLNVRNIEDLRTNIEDPFNTSLNPDLDGIFSPNLIKELNIATNTRFTPVKIIEDKSNGTKKVRVDVSLPASIKSASLFNDQNQPESNHVKIRLDGLKLFLEAVTLSENTTSTFSKEFSLPKGTNTNNVKYFIDEEKHSLILEALYNI